MFIRRTKMRGAEGGKVTTPTDWCVPSVAGSGCASARCSISAVTLRWQRSGGVVQSDRQLLERQGVLVELECPEEVEREAQRIALQLVQRGAEVAWHGSANGGRGVAGVGRGRWGWSMWGYGRSGSGELSGVQPPAARWRWGRSGGWHIRASWRMGTSTCSKRIRLAGVRRLEVDSLSADEPRLSRALA